MSSIAVSRDLQNELIGGQHLPDNEHRSVIRLRDLLDKLLVLDPSKRLTINNAMTHPFIMEQI